MDCVLFHNVLLYIIGLLDGNGFNLLTIECLLDTVTFLTSKNPSIFSDEYYIKGFQTFIEVEWLVGIHI